MQCREEAEDACGEQPRAFFVWHCGFFQDLELKTMKFAVFFMPVCETRKGREKEPEKNLTA